MRSFLLPAAALIAAGSLFTPAAYADQGCDPAVMQFYKADGLADTRVGWNKMADMCWQAADSNGDGVVDPTEWSNFFGNLFDQVDTNGDGKASVDEINRLQQSD